MLGPAHRMVDAFGIVHRLADARRPIVQLDPALDFQVRLRKVRLHDELVVRRPQVIHDRRCLAVHGQTAGGLLSRRSAKNVQAEVVPHDS